MSEAKETDWVRRIGAIIPDDDRSDLSPAVFGLLFYIAFVFPVWDLSHGLTPWHVYCQEPGLAVVYTFAIPLASGLLVGGCAGLKWYVYFMAALEALLYIFNIWLDSSHIMFNLSVRLLSVGVFILGAFVGSSLIKRFRKRAD